MTKAEELTLLDKIAGLIAESGEDSYITMTFAGIVDVCQRNIENDFGDSPVDDCANMRVALDAERRMHDETKRMLREAMNEIESLKSQVRNMGDDSARLTEEKETIAECLDGMHGICDQQDAEIRKLKAEIVRMRYERMTEDDMARWYDIEKMNEEV